ncbi:MAG: hypothetical protein WCA84_14785 [Ignavibacteriaceae bacterium]
MPKNQGTFFNEADYIIPSSKIENVLNFNTDAYRDKYSNYLRKSIELLSYLSNKAISNSNKIIDFIFVALIVASKSKIDKTSLFEEYEKIISQTLNLTDDEDQPNIALIILLSLLEYELPIKSGENIKELYNKITEAFIVLEKLKNGEDKQILIINYLNNCLGKLFSKKQIKEIQIISTKHFINFSEFRNEIEKLLNQIKNNNFNVAVSINILNALLLLFHRASENPENIINDIIENKILLENETQILIIGLFISRFYHYYPFNYNFNASFLDLSKDQVVAPLVAVFLAPEIILEAATVEKISKNELFWQYTFQKNDSIFLLPVIEENNNYLGKKTINAKISSNILEIERINIYSDFIKTRTKDCLYTDVKVINELEL